MFDWLGGWWWLSISIRKLTIVQAWVTPAVTLKGLVIKTADLPAVTYAVDYAQWWRFTPPDTSGSLRDPTGNIITGCHQYVDLQSEWREVMERKCQALPLTTTWVRVASASAPLWWQSVNGEKWPLIRGP